MLYYSDPMVNIYCGDCQRIDGLPLADLVITSPPYNLDINYGEYSDLSTWSGYLAWTYAWAVRVCEFTSKKARLCVNIPLDTNKGDAHRAFYAEVVKIIQETGWIYRNTIVWNESNISKRTAWGSWMSPSAPSVIAPVEMIAVFYKDRWNRGDKSGKLTADITREEFMEYVLGMWTFSGEHSKLHPAAFPLELPKRLIKLFSYKEDMVLDPFCGSGTTLLAAKQLERHSIGVELDKRYCEIAAKRVAQDIIQW